MCENDLLSFSCPTNSIMQILNVSYGRNDKVTCGFWDCCKNDCLYNQTLMIESQCNIQNSCSITASNSIFGDPCYGNKKYLKVTYECSGKKKG